MIDYDNKNGQLWLIMIVRMAKSGQVWLNDGREWLLVVSHGLVLNTGVVHMFRNCPKSLQRVVCFLAAKVRDTRYTWFLGVMQPHLCAHGWCHPQYHHEGITSYSPSRLVSLCGPEKPSPAT